MILIPDSIWNHLLDAFAAAPPGVERVAFLDGVRSVDTGVVTTLAVPDADLHPGWYDVSAEAMSNAGRHLREHRLARLAQVHTHGTRGCGHSARDDRNAYSQRENALSIVLPLHASRRPVPHDGTIHLRTPYEWKALTAEEALAAVRLVPSFIDLRSTAWTTSRTDMKEPSTGGWHRLMRRARRLFR